MIPIPLLTLFSWGRGKKKEEPKKLAPFKVRRDLCSEDIKLLIAKSANKHKVHAAISNPMNKPRIQVEIEEGFWKMLLAHRKEVLGWYEKSKYRKTLINDTLDAVAQRLDLTNHPDLNEMNVHFSKGPGDVEREVTSIYE